MSSHTPGPWTAGSKTVRAPETEDRLPLDVRLFGGNANDHRANARLIAAAPELLQALQLLHDDIAEYARLNNLGGFDNHVMKLARAAIAKATGRPA